MLKALMKSLWSVKLGGESRITVEKILPYYTKEHLEPCHWPGEFELLLKSFAYLITIPTIAV